MYINIDDNLRDIFQNDFEDYIADKLEALGFQCFKSVYAKYSDIESQIDVVAVSRYCILCVECKSWDAVYVDWRRTNLNWSYINPYGDCRFIKNPLRQSRNHARTLRMDLVENLESEVFEKYGQYTYPCYPLVVVKGSATRTRGRLASTSSNNLYFCNDLEDIKSRYFLKVVTNLDKEVMEEHIKYLKDKQDRSKKRLVQHAMYIEECKRNKTGLWRPTEQSIYNH